MKKHSAQFTLRVEPHDYDRLARVARYRDVPVAVVAREMMLEKLSERLEELEAAYSGLHDDTRGAMLCGIIEIEDRRARQEGEPVCA